MSARSSLFYLFENAPIVLRQHSRCEALLAVRTWYPEKNLSEQGLNPNNGLESRATLIGGERSHHCAGNGRRNDNFYIQV